MNRFLLFSIFVVATCGLIYELAAGTLASYLLGDSVTQFSTIIGVYLFSMGIGSFLSKYIHKNLITWFVKIEILIGLIGGLSSTVLFLLFEEINAFKFLLYFIVCLTGTLVGLEIPIIMRILSKEDDFKDMIANVFTFDYVGALFASILFPILFVPYLGIAKTSLFFGLINLFVALILCHKDKANIKNPTLLKTACYFSILILSVCFFFSETLVTLSENKTFDGKIFYATNSPYQRIILTRQKDAIKLYLNGNLQFSSNDEYRYHEALVHPVIQSLQSREHILILGGGDGLALREVLKYDDVKTVTLVDLDSKITSLFKSHPLLTQLNHSALNSSKVQIINTDAFEWLKNNTQKFDGIIVDFPDPNNFSVGKLYSNTFYKTLKKSIQDKGAICIQSTSPFVAKKSYWCVNNTLKSVGFNTIPYHCFVPSFGDWGYIIATKTSFNTPIEYPPNLRFISASAFSQMIHFPLDMLEVKTEINRLDNQILVNYFDEEWSKIF